MRQATYTTHMAPSLKACELCILYAHTYVDDADDDVQLAGSRPLAHLLIFQKGVRAQISIIYVTDLMLLKWEF